MSYSCLHSLLWVDTSIVWYETFVIAIYHASKRLTDSTTSFAAISFHFTNRRFQTIIVFRNYLFKIVVNQTWHWTSIDRVRILDYYVKQNFVLLLLPKELQNFSFDSFDFHLTKTLRWTSTVVKRTKEGAWLKRERLSEHCLLGEFSLDKNERSSEWMRSWGLTSYMTTKESLESK